MKPFRFFTCVVVLCGMATFTSCEKEDISSFRSAPLISTKGTLLFRVFDGSKQEIPGVTMSIARNEFDIHHNTYIATHVTDVKGRADFGILEKGEYFYKAECFIDGTRYYKEGSVQVQRDRELIRDVVLK